MEDVLYRLLLKVEPFWWTLSIILMDETLSLMILKILVMEIKRGTWMFDQLCIGVQADCLLLWLKESSWAKCLICCFFYFLGDKSLLVCIFFDFSGRQFVSSILLFNDDFCYCPLSGSKGFSQSAPLAHIVGSFCRMQKNSHSACWT